MADHPHLMYLIRVAILSLRSVLSALEEFHGNEAGANHQERLRMKVAADRLEEATEYLTRLN